MRTLRWSLTAVSCRTGWQRSLSSWLSVRFVCALAAGWGAERVTVVPAKGPDMLVVVCPP